MMKHTNGRNTSDIKFKTVFNSKIN